MMEQQPIYNNQEIDLAQVSKKIREKIAGLNNLFNKFILFIIRNALVLGILFIIGAGLGYYIDKTNKVYNHELIVAPNFGSVNYLYSKIELLDSKVKEGDTLYLKSLGIENPKRISELKIKPVNSLYDFVNQRETNFELLKLLAEDGSIDKVVEGDLTSKNYTYHIISFSTKNKSAKDNIIAPLLKFLNENNYYSLLKNQHVINVEAKMKLNDSIIKQIDNIVTKFSTEGSSKSASLVYNENAQLAEILKRKDELINETASYRIALINYSDVVKEVSSTLNFRSTDGLAYKMKFLLPVLLMLFYIIIVRSFKTFKRIKRNTYNAA